MDNKKIASLGIVGAIILLLTFIPYTGYIVIGPISITIIPIFITIFAWYMGMTGAIVSSLFFGLGSYFKALSGMGGPVAVILFTEHPDLPIISRLLTGITIGIIIHYLKELKLWKFFLTSFLTFLLNTTYFIVVYQIIRTYASELATFDALMILIYVNVIAELAFSLLIAFPFYKLVLVLNNNFAIKDNKTW